MYYFFTKFKHKSFQGYLPQKLWCTDRFCKHLWLIQSLLLLPHSLLRPIHFWLQDLCEHTSKKKRRFNFSLTLFKTSTPFRAYHLVSSSSSQKERGFCKVSYTFLTFERCNEIAMNTRSFTTSLHKFIFNSYDIINSFQLSLRSDRELKQRWRQRKQQKVPNFTFCRGREHKAGNDFLFLFLNFDIFF